MRSFSSVAMMLLMSHLSGNGCVPGPCAAHPAPPGIHRGARAPPCSTRRCRQQVRAPFAGVRPSACMRRQRSIAAWLPPSSTAATPSRPHLGPRVMRPVEQPVGERLLHGRVGIAERPGSSRATGVDQHQGRQLAAAQHQRRQSTSDSSLRRRRTARPLLRSGRPPAPGSATPESSATLRCVTGAPSAAR